MAQSEINRATKNRESVKKHIRLEPAKNRRTVKNWAASAGQFRFIDIMATIKKTKRSPLRTPLIKYEPTVGLEPPPPVADFVSAPSGHLRSLSPPSLAAFPGNYSKPSQFPGAHFASWFKILCPLNKKTAHIFMHGAISEPTVGLEPTPTVADFVSAPSGRLRSLSVPSMAPFPENCSKPSQFSGAHFASQFVFSLIYKKTVPFSCTVKFQADCQTRTDYLRVTSALLYLVS